MVELVIEGNLQKEEYKDRNDITKVTIRDATTVPAGCFWGCDSLECVVLGHNVEEIDFYAFKDCASLKYVFADNEKKYIRVQDRAFENCVSLNDLSFFNRISFFGTKSFHNCTSLNTVTIGAKTEKIYATAFNGTKLTAFNIDSRNKYYYIKDSFLIERKKDDKKETFKALKYIGTNENCIIPQEVTRLSNVCFREYGDLIKELTLPSGLNSIMDNYWNDDEYVFGETTISDEGVIEIPQSDSELVSDVFNPCIKKKMKKLIKRKAKVKKEKTKTTENVARGMMRSKNETIIQN